MRMGPEESLTGKGTLCRKLEEQALSPPGSPECRLSGDVSICHETPLGVDRIILPAKALRNAMPTGRGAE
jgi:hypothetical protein